MSGVDGPTLLRLSPKAASLSIYPINTLEGTTGYLGPKYEQIRRFTLHLDTIGDAINAADIDESDVEAILETLPRGFVKDYSYGLGLLKDFNRLVRLIEEHTDCTDLVFTDSDEEAVVGTEFRIGLSRFDAIWSEIRRINDRGNRAAARVKDSFVHNTLADALGLQPADANLGRHPISRLITLAAKGAEPLTDEERDQLIAAVASESAVLAKADPEKLVELQREIELVSLDQLIEHLESSLGRRTNEAYWQEFFDRNAFALQQVFGAPMINVQSGAAVGGSDVAGRGGKIADYMFKNSLTNNIALVEIKTPTTPLLGNAAYRGGVFGPSKELSGAVTQALDQAHQLVTNLATLKNNSRRWDLESYAATCLVIIGRTPSADEPDRQKSLELYRANLRSVSVVTYDEILERLKVLRAFLVSTDEPAPDDGNNS
ncbi:MAG: DUF4263 domain-containing protein [Ilumatobacter fluminis]|uniref:Shedu immune nuclease family protein n=1 Tax=Ilumatobacter fluminis TaxID=467091 RepID=UPI0032EB3EF9